MTAPDPKAVAEKCAHDLAENEGYLADGFCLICTLDDLVKARATIDTLTRERGEARGKIATLFDAIAHGDEKHRAWLKQAIEDHFAARALKGEA